MISAPTKIIIFQKSKKESYKAQKIVKFDIQQVFNI
jgi:hypothetical protein